MLQSPPQSHPTHSSSQKIINHTTEDMNIWSQLLPIEILVTILLKSCLLDRIRAGAVCVSWRLALNEIKAHKLHPPLLMLSKDSATDIHHFLDLSNNTIYGLNIPNAHDVYYLGSFDRWWILVKWITREFFLLNPYSKERIELPRQATIWNFGNASLDYLEDLGQDGDIPVSAATLSSAPTSDDCVVVIIHSMSKLSLCRLGDATWTVIDGILFHDVACYKGCVCAIRPSDFKISKLGFDPESIGWNVLPPNEFEIEEDYNVNEAYLVESCAELLMVLRLHYNHNESFLTSRATQEFRIFKMDPSGRFSIKVESLGDQMIFLSKSCSKSLSAKGLLGFEGNCIYFIDDHACDLSVFHIEDRSIQQCFPRRYFSPKLIPFIWLTQ